MIYVPVFIVIVANLIHYKMAEGQHGIDDAEVAGKRALHSVIDDLICDFQEDCSVKEV